jgi:hypothetical protein
LVVSASTLILPLNKEELCGPGTSEVVAVEVPAAGLQAKRMADNTTEKPNNIIRVFLFTLPE